MGRRVPNGSQKYGPHSDRKFSLHHQQPRADKLCARQRRLCRQDPAFAEALRRRVADPVRFDAFVSGATSYLRLAEPCKRCGGYKRRVRDRSCYQCHLARSGENFERMKAGIAPKVKRSLDNHLDVLARQRADRVGPAEVVTMGRVTARRWLMGQLEVTFDNGETEADINSRSFGEIMNAMVRYPELRDVLRWAGWSVD